VRQLAIQGAHLLDFPLSLNLWRCTRVGADLAECHARVMRSPDRGPTTPWSKRSLGRTPSLGRRPRIHFGPAVDRAAPEEELTASRWECSLKYL
jgi:hypothetical protein